VGTGLERRPRLRGREEERALEVEVLGDPANGGRMRGVEDVEALVRKGPAQDLGREARPAHPEQHDVPEAGGRGRELLQLRDPLTQARGLIEPAEPAVLVLAGPQRGVAPPDALDQLRGVHGRHLVAQP
jgi:hypothetical protein